MKDLAQALNEFNVEADQPVGPPCSPSPLLEEGRPQYPPSDVLLTEGRLQELSDVKLVQGRLKELESEADSFFELEVQPLFNPSNPAYTLKRERPEHRIIVMLKAQGYTNVEIARQIGWTTPGIANIVKQSWARELILKEITKAGRNQVEAVLQGEALNSVLKLIDIRDDEEVAAEVQRKAANDLLDRMYGKPNTPVTHIDGNVKTLSDAQLSKIASQALSKTN